ncbi:MULTISPECIES: AAA family ATPase [unclassified Colwellia]|uniref:AAA family ATPase n=1 Tax=unclassified Colwellia TaxID=196834 RepID=UPI0015F3EF33|nr:MULTISPECIES: AAA family ATPase [unclassified Colwellia]MBA6356627.1 AAA family ATPase [Colwellia sp. BRX8-3]MBA6361187.1 AAA family ATPase [Colwellia sp. BRX8-6]MBA6368399.1 AAA family ATPase [Colwellia sp. BRX8-5]MBA6377289.1 AAA family ATPase [Colwellia sp. BRX8-2]
MNLNKLLNTFFEYRTVQCSEMPMDDSMLEQSDVVLPLVLLYIQLAIKNTKLEDKVLKCKLVKQTESLCYLAAENIEFIDEYIALNIIEELGGYNAIEQIEDNRPCFVEIESLVTMFRKYLQNIPERQSLDDNAEFYQHYSQVFKLELDEDFIETQIEIAESYWYEDKLSVNSAIEDGEARKLPFELKEQYVRLKSPTQHFFDELSVLACSVYLSAHPSIEVQNIKVTEMPEIDCSLVLSALIGTPSFLTALASQFQCQPSQVLMPDDVYHARKNLKHKAVTRSFSVNNETTKNWYQITKSFAAKLVLNENVKSCCDSAFIDNEFNVSLFIKALLKIKHQSITKLSVLNQCGNRIGKAIKVEQKLKRDLNKQVIGQRKAIESLTNGYLTSNIGLSEGPRLIFTFAGPSGVGKTYLSSIFCDLLNKYEQSGYAFTTFNMEQYADKQDAMKLFGSGLQYNEANLGVLTSAVRSQPRQILLFDEIEKAHPNVTQSLLSILDKGIAQDQTSQEFISFDQCIVIFTTNLGQEVLANNHQKHQLNIFDVLRHAENPATKTKLSVEFINRLAKGYSVAFTPLQINHFVYLAEKELNKRNDHQEMLDFTWPEYFASFLLQSLAPEITARQLSNCLAKLKAEILVKASSLITEDMSPISCVISVNENTPDLDVKQLLLFDNDSRLKSQLAQSELALSANIIDNFEDIRTMLEQHRPDAFLVDIESVANGQLSLNEVTDHVNLINSRLPIFSYRVADTQADSLEEQTLIHNVREHFELDLSTFEQSFPAMLKRINYYLTMEKTLLRMTTRNEQLQYQCRVKRNNKVLDVSFTNLSCRQVIQSKDLQETSLFNHSLPDNSLDDVIGLERAKRRLSEVVSWLKAPEKLLNFGVKIPTGFLFAGPPGTGKTLLAKAVAGECELPFFSVAASELSSPYSGGTTENIKELFNTARKYAPSIVFIDEIDAIATQRTNNSDSSSRDKNLTVNALLTEMDGFSTAEAPVFVMAATNHPQLLDSAITRPGRFDETIYCDLPNKNARLIFFKRFACKHKLNWQEEDLQQLVSSAQGMSSAEIDQVLRESIYQAVGDNKQLTTEYIKQTMIRIVYGAPSEHILLGEEEKRRTAYHEAGHLLVNKILFPKQRIDFVTIEPRNQSLGFVATRAAEEYESYSKRRVMNQLQVLLAGRVAEKLCTQDSDEVSTGASNDIEKATQLAMHAIYEGGIEASVGPVNVAMLTKFEESDLLSNAQLAVKQWLEQAEQQVEKLLTEHYQQLTLVAETLLDKESLLGDEIDLLFDN